MIDLTLPTMSCQHCVRTITQAAEQVDANAKLSFDLPARRVQIDSSKPRDAFVAALREEGFESAPN
jgi:copper chaperone